MSAVKGALKSLGEGFKSTDLTTSGPAFTVTIDPKLVTMDKLVEALKASGEPVGPRP